jgi:hypothetical protein
MIYMPAFLSKNGSPLFEAHGSFQKRCRTGKIAEEPDREGCRRVPRAFATELICMAFSFISDSDGGYEQGVDL